jgi:hypothetical protein
MFQLGFGWSAVEAGAMLLWLFAGNLAIKPATTALLHRFGFRRVLLGNGLLVAAGLRGLRLAGTRHPRLWTAALVFVSGMNRSMQFTATSTLAYADVPQAQMRHATTLFSVLAQMNTGMGIALGALALSVTELLRGTGRPARRGRLPGRLPDHGRGGPAGAGGLLAPAGRCRPAGAPALNLRAVGRVDRLPPVSASLPDAMPAAPAPLPVALRWVRLVLLTLALTLPMAWLHVPAPSLLGAIVAGVALGLAGQRVRVPMSAFMLSQAVLGFMIARACPLPVFAELMRHWEVFLLGVTSVIVLSVGLGWQLARWKLLPARRRSGALSPARPRP